MAVIKSGATSDQWTIDPTSKAGRVTLYDTSGAVVSPATSAAEGTLGAATPAKAVQIGVDDGSNLQAPASASAANLTGDQTVGKQVQAVVPFSAWSVTSSAAATTQATVSKAANASGRHVATGYMVSFFVATTTQAGVSVGFTIRDGATGAGTVLWSGRFGQNVAGAHAQNQMNDIALIGSTNTAMTIEFSGAGTTGSLQNVNLIGFDTV